MASFLASMPSRGGFSQLASPSSIIKVSCHLPAPHPLCRRLWRACRALHRQILHLRATRHPLVFYVRTTELVCQTKGVEPHLPTYNTEPPEDQAPIPPGPSSKTASLSYPRLRDSSDCRLDGSLHESSHPRTRVSHHDSFHPRPRDSIMNLFTPDRTLCLH